MKKGLGPVQDRTAVVAVPGVMMICRTMETPTR